MVLKLVFFDKLKYNQTWINRLFDRLERVQERKWRVSGGSALGSDSIEFDFLMEDGSKIEKQPKQVAQKIFNEIIWVFVMEQLNVNRFVVDGHDMTEKLSHR